MASLLDLSQLTARTDRAGLVRAPVPASPYVTDNVRTANNARQALIEARRRRLLAQAVTAMQDIESLAAQLDSLKYIEEHKVHRDIIDCLKEFQPGERTDSESAQRLQCAAYSALLVLSCRTQKLRMSIQINQDLLRHLTETLEQLIDAEQTKMTRHLGLLLELLCSVQLAGPLRRCMWRHEKIINFAKTAFVGGADGVDSQEQTVLIVRAAALLLDTYYCSSSWADHVTRFFCDQHARLASLLARRYAVEFCMRALCPLFGELCCYSGEFRRRMLADGVHRQLAESVRQLCRLHGSLPDLLALNVEALCRLHCPTSSASPPTSPQAKAASTAATSSPAVSTVSEAVRDAGLLSEVLRVLLRYPDRHPQLQLACFTLFSYTVDCVYRGAADASAQTGCSSGSQLEQDWLRAMQLGFLHYAHEEEITQAICRALAKLLRWRPELVAHVGDEPNQFPIHTHIRLQFANKDHKPRLMAAVLDAVFWLAVQNQRLQTLLATQSLGGGGIDQRPTTEDSTPMLIVSCLTVHADSEEIYYYGFRALRALCVFSKERKLTVYLLSCMAEDRWNILDLIGRSFHRFRANCLVLTEAVTLLACLADVDLIRHQCLIPKPSSLHSASSPTARSQYHHHQAQLQPALHKELLELLRDCQGSSREFLEAGLECLCVLAAAGFETETELAVLDLLLAAMQRHRDSFVVQKCGLILLQLLPKEFAVSSAADNQQQHHHGEVVDRVCSAVVGALRAFPNALGVQAEGCVAALLLCRRSPRFAPCLVENDAFDCLFHIVRTSLKKRGLLRLAAECLLELVLSRGQKDAALLRAIRNGNSKLARCLLELGANPNAVSAEDSSSLICLALASFQSPSDLLDTVYCLLEKGAVNTQSALEKSLTLGTDMVTGLLLKHLGYYKQGSFGSITWCNLKLQSFQARWLDPVIKPRTPEQELTEVRIRKVSKLIREAARSHHSNGGGLNSPRRRASTAASSASTSGAPAAGAGAGSAGAVIGLDDILPERYRLAQWTSASNPGKTSQPSETGSQQQLDIVDDGRRQQQQQSGGGGMSRRGSMVSLLLGRMPPFFKRADSLGEVRGDGDKQQQSRQKQDTQPGKKKLSDGADSSAASASNASAKSNSRDRRRTLAPEVLASQIEQFRKRSDTIRSDPDAAVAGVAAAASTSEVPSGPASYSTSDIQFQPVEGELQEFYQSTLSSSNLPYSQLDPRLRLPHPKQRPRHRQVEQQPAAGNNLEVRRGSYLLRCADADAAACDASAAVAVSENPNGEDDDDDYDVDDVDDDNDDDDDEIGDEVDESICGDEECFDDETTDFSEDAGRHRGRRLLLEAGTSEDSGGCGGGDHSDSVVKVRRHRRLLRDPRARQLRSNTAVHIGAFKPSARPEQLRLIDLSANCIPDVDSLACIAADIDLQVSLAFLNRLSLANNKLTRLPQGVFQFLSNLAHVELNGNRLIEFPYELITCCRLEYLDVSDNDIVELREERLQWVGAVFTLRELLLSRNKLRSVPMRFLENLYGLERLMLNGNRIGELEPAPLQLKRLRCLSLASNYIRAVPDEFLGCLTNLEEFDASCNELEVLPTPETSRKLYHLSTVRLSNNQLGAKDPLSVPSFVLELSILKSIDLSYNSIDQFPSPKNWASAVLREIDLSHNRIDSVNLNGGDRWSKTLERFSLAYNEIKTLHKGIGQLESLASLDLSHNPNLTSLPDEIGNLSKLWEMPLDGLKLSLDASLIRGRTKDLVGYFHQKLNKSVSHYRMKLMLVGFGGRGKTSLLRALMKLKQPERQSPPTVGIAVTPWSFRCYHRKQKWVTYQLSCWDFAGQEEFYATHQCFLSQRAIYLLIYSLQSCFTVEGCDAELRRLKPWLVNIKAQAPACPVICVGTHADTLPSSGPNRDTIIANIRTRIETMIRRPGFPEIVEYVEVNAIRDNASVERLRTVIQSALEAFKVKGHHVMGQMVPESYVKLETLVMERARNTGQDLPVLQWYQLRKMATDAGLNMNDEKLSQAVRFLHESGVLLHFDDSTYRLNNLYFIDPQWLCRMMAQIVTVKEINGFIRSGVMRQSDLGLLFTGKRITEEDRHFIFPVSQIPQYLRILEKFEIVLPQKNDELLIPCRLPDIAARDVTELAPVRRHSNLVTRLYQMPFIPIGFWPRLVARLYNIIDEIYPAPCTQLDLGTSSSSSSTAASSPCAPSILKMGKRVMFACWQPPATGTAAAAATAASYDEAFFLLQTFEEATPEGGEGLQLQVPLCPNGAYLLAQIADNIDVVIEEWYPGLTDRTVTGECILQKSAPCVACCSRLNIRSPKSQQQQQQPHQARSSSSAVVFHTFSFDDIVNEAGIAEAIRCPRFAETGHPELVPLSSLAPDVTLSDLAARLQLDSNRLELVQTQDHLLGQGSFGSVYRAEYNGGPCAVKIFSLATGDTPTYRLLRQESGILSRLDHPALVRMLAVGCRPYQLVLELAPMGALHQLLQQKRIRDRGLQHRLMHQVTQGLAFLHQRSIIYRDLKLDNVLVFSLSTERTVVNVKLSDYGISRFATPYGFSQPEGTPGYRAPEVINGEVYGLSADVYSLGIVLYGIVTNGRHPFENSCFRDEFDEATLKATSIDPLFKKGCPDWPHLELIINRCLIRREPNKRPAASEVLAALCRPEFLCLRAWIQVSARHGVDCMVARSPGLNRPKLGSGSGGGGSVGGSNGVDIVCACSGINSIEMVHTKLYSDSVSSLTIRGRRALSMALIGGMAIVGTVWGQVHLYDFAHNKICLAINNLMPDAVVSITEFSPNEKYRLVLFGLANGEIAILHRDKLLKFKEATPVAFLSPDNERAPIHRLQPTKNNKLLVAKGSKLFSLSLRRNSTEPIKASSMQQQQPAESRETSGDAVLGRWNWKMLRKFNTSRGGAGSIYCLACTRKSIFLTLRNDNRVHVMDKHGNELRQPINAQQLISQLIGQPISDIDARVTALCALNSKRFALGTGGGHFLVSECFGSGVFNSFAVRLQNRPIRAVKHVKVPEVPAGSRHTLQNRRRICAAFDGVHQSAMSRSGGPVMGGDCGAAAAARQMRKCSTDMRTKLNEMFDATDEDPDTVRSFIIVSGSKLEQQEMDDDAGDNEAMDTESVLVDEELDESKQTKETGFLAVFQDDLLEQNALLRDYLRRRYELMPAATPNT
ncbi:hypothetical protein BOX15_Mlig015348g2 [Macrostomum lignano]|uniref:non-specific serine/threonine protein kinase n=2 Tax=Macrostomum lignano TaxID=282301 RepID=A0A267FUW0_9PLAT|nr:hypothetical protein BOX15_Mlig015348g2 [Macrostomum lignano]